MDPLPANLNDLDHDLQSFNNLFIEYQVKFLNFASTYVVDRMAAEDIVMEAIMYYWENRKRLSSDIVPPAYILTSIKNKCLNYLRDRQTYKDVSEKIREHEAWRLSLQISTLEACNPNELLSEEMHKLVNDALNKLPNTTRRIFIMRRFEEKSYREIASEMNMSVKGIEYHMAKAADLLRKDLKEFLPILIYLLYY